MATASVGLVALGIVSALVWQVMQEQQRTAKAREDFGESFKLLSIADDLTMRGMGQMAMSAMGTRPPDASARSSAFYGPGRGLYDRLPHGTRPPLRVQALAFR